MLIIVPIVGTAIVTVLYLVRVYSHQLVVHGIGIEDALMVLGLLFTYGVAICIVYCGFKFPAACRVHGLTVLRFLGRPYHEDNLGLAPRAATVHCTTEASRERMGKEGPHAIDRLVQVDSGKALTLRPSLCEGVRRPLSPPPLGSVD